MADERTCYAGDLGSDALGRQIKHEPERSARYIVPDNIEHARNKATGVKTTRLVGHNEQGQASTRYIFSDTVVEVIVQ